MSMTIGRRVVVPDVRFYPISASEWRVSDARVPATDAKSLLGFVEKTDVGTFQLMQLGHGHGVTWMRFDSLDEVRDHFAKHAS